MLKDLGCSNAINLDGGGSTGFIVNNRQTVRPGDNGVERIVPSVVVIKKK
jgi:exopolysaccharide biosynthesis protein